MTTRKSQIPSPLLALHAGGMVTAIGTSMPQTAASWANQTRRMRRVTLEGHADPFTIADCEAVTKDLAGPDRLIAMLGSAIAEAFVGVNALPLDKPVECLEILALPDWLTPDGADRISKQVSDWLRPYDAWNARVSQRKIVRGEASAAWSALDLAYQALDNTPNLRHVMIAAADSLCDPAYLRHAAEADRLLRKDNSDGYVPGEAAACLLLTRVDNIRAVQANGFALHRPALTKAEEQLWPSASQTGDKPLAEALAAALQHSGMQPTNISHLESNMDGSTWRARIESTALSRVIFSETTALPQLRPANLLGQTGAVSGVLDWLLPVILHARQLEPINTVLNWAVEPGGNMAACVLERSPQ